MKLYKVEAYAYVIADDESEVLDVLVNQGALPADNGMTVDVFQTESVDEEWWDVVPFGSDGDTCGRIVQQIRGQQTLPGMGVNDGSK